MRKLSGFLTRHGVSHYQMSSLSTEPNGLQVEMAPGYPYVMGGDDFFMGALEGPLEDLPLMAADGSRGCLVNWIAKKRMELQC